jgi:hypothetical protein
VEPFKLRRWRRKASQDPLPFFTCARPGRSISKQDSVPDKTVDKWVTGLPGATDSCVVSLLGRKPDGVSEFSFYSFFGKSDPPTERRSRKSFQDWLDSRHPERRIRVFEHPTVDLGKVPLEVLDAAASDIGELLAAGRTVILIDSGGETRTGQLCRHMGLVEDPRTW